MLPVVTVEVWCFFGRLHIQTGMSGLPLLGCGVRMYLKQPAKARICSDTGAWAEDVCVSSATFKNKVPEGKHNKQTNSDLGNGNKLDPGKGLT